MKRVINLVNLVGQLNKQSAETKDADLSILLGDASAKLVELSGELVRVTELRNQFSERLSLMLARVDELEKQLQAIDDAGICLPESVATGRGDDDDEVEQPLPESIGDDGGIFVYGVNGLGEPVIVGKATSDTKPPGAPQSDAQKVPKLEVERANVFKVEYGDLDDFISEVFGIEFEIVAEEELNNHTDKTYSVSKKPMDEYWRNRFAAGKYSTQELLNEACYRGLIEPGEYVIHIFW